MARNKVSRMVAEKTKKTMESRFSTDSFSIEANKTLLKHKTMTFSAIVAMQMGYTQGEMNLILVWKDKRMNVRFTRDSHPGGGWRSNKEDFVKFVAEVDFRKNQGYNIFQVPGFGAHAFEFEKSWEYFPRGGTVLIPGVLSGPQPQSGGAVMHGQSSEPSRQDDVLLWCLLISARKTTRGAAVMLKKNQRSGNEDGARPSVKRSFCSADDGGKVVKISFCSADDV